MKKTMLASMMLVFSLTMAGCSGKKSEAAVSVPPSEKPTAAPVSSMTPEPTPSPSAPATAEPAAAAAPTPAATAASVSYEASSIGTFKVTVSGLNIRSGPSVSEKSLGRAAEGKTYSVYAVKEAGGYTWYQIGTGQWIADQGSWGIYQPSSIRTVEDLTGSTSKQVSGAGGYVTIGSSAIHIRSAHSVSAGIIGKASPGQNYPVYEVYHGDSSYDWIRIADGQWIATDKAWTWVKSTEYSKSSATASSGTITVHERIRIRSGHSASASVLGKTAAGETYPVYEVYHEDPSYDWIRIGEGKWIATDKAWTWVSENR
ncbi:MAG: hypothetical protein ACI4WR_02555 [Bulleidia sp.]